MTGMEGDRELAADDDRRTTTRSLGETGGLRASSAVEARPEGGEGPDANRKA